MSPSDELEPAGEPQQGAEWTPYHAHLHYTCAVIQNLQQNGLEGWKPIPTMVRLEDGELTLAEGPSGRAYFKAVGNGSYQRRSSFAFGRSSFVLGMMAADAISNSAARKRAKADMEPRWIQQEPGSVLVTERRVHFWNATHAFSMFWRGLDMVDLDGPDAVVIRFKDKNTGAPWTVRLQTYWAVLIFALAAHTAFPAHPRWMSGEWLPEGFEDHCVAAGYSRPDVR